MQSNPALIESRPYEVRAYSPSTREWTLVATVIATSPDIAIGYARLKQLVPSTITLVAKPKPLI